jgi:hypothetical protein
LKALLSPAGALALSLLVGSGAGAQASERAKGTPLPRCLLYNSYRLTPQGMMQCSYQCGDRIIMRSGYQVCAQSWARPEPGKP